MKTWCTVITRANFITFSLLLRVSEKTLMLFIPCRSLTQNLHNSGIYVRTSLSPVYYDDLLHFQVQSLFWADGSTSDHLVGAPPLPHRLLVSSFGFPCTICPSPLLTWQIGSFGPQKHFSLTLDKFMESRAAPLFWSHTGSIHGLPNNDVALQFILKRGISTF